MIGSFSMSCRYFFTSRILTTQEIPLEYKSITCLPRALPFFSPFSFSSRYLYSAYFLWVVSSLALSTFYSVHLLANKYALPLLVTLFKHSCFLCCSVPSFGVSTVSPKKSSSFNIFSILAIAFIRYLNRHQMRNNVRYKDNTNNVSVTIF